MFLCLLGLKFYGEEKKKKSNLFFFFIRKRRMLGLFDMDATMLGISGELLIFSWQWCIYIMLFKHNNMFNVKVNLVDGKSDIFDVL